jgi:hypothetical protein
MTRVAWRMRMYDYRVAWRMRMYDARTTEDEDSQSEWMKLKYKGQESRMKDDDE